MDRPHSPLPDTPSRDLLPPRSSSPPPQQHFHQHTFSIHNNAPSHHQFHIHDAYQAYPRPDSRLSDSRLLPPPTAIPPRHPATPDANTEDPLPPPSPSHKRLKHDNSLPPPYPCPVDQRWASLPPSSLIAFSC
ncbi:hypothetical protein BC628DRAFT_1424101 [Trametes gibbosa]|nr:hypothetical protein BC628DRAFT_1424101 [Trametes gibbosa]